MSDSRGGLAYGAGAYLIWGFFPLYWPLLAPAGSLEVLAHRIAWSLVVVSVLLAATSGWSRFWAIARTPKRLALVGGAAIAIAINWGTFIYGVTSGHVIETSLGYFMNPLVFVLIGVVFLGERLRRLQWVAVAVAIVAVSLVTIAVGRPPWIALSLALSFATYGWLKKHVNLGTVEGLGWETLLLSPVAIAYLLWLQGRDELVFGHEGVGNAVLLALTGVVTAVPLLLFGAAATRLPLSSIGLLQYMTPLMQLALGLVVFGETMSPLRWVGFIIVWAALVVFTVDALRSRRRTAPPAPVA